MPEPESQLTSSSSAPSLFAPKVLFVFEKLKCEPTSILLRVILSIFKVLLKSHSYFNNLSQYQCILEKIRTKTISRNGSQQVQVDTEYMRMTFMKVLPDPKYFTLFFSYLLPSHSYYRIYTYVKEIQAEAASRCTDPLPMEDTVRIFLFA